MNDSTHPLLHGLNAQQRAAVTTPAGPVLVLAGPGSGKTRVLTHRIAWLLTELRIPAWQVLAVTFTNRAAREMRHRLTDMLGDTSAREMTLGTFHAACVRILRREAEAANLAPNYAIFDSDDQLAVMKQVVKDMNLDDKRYKPRALLNAVSSAKNELIAPDAYPIHTYYDEIIARAYGHYQQLLRNSDGLDFDDLLMKTANLFRDNPLVREKYQRRYRNILVDEFQDTNMAQYVILKALGHEHQHLYVVADEDQSIYSWRGADYRNIRRLREDFPKLTQYLLEENYRSTQVILDAAQAIIAGNRDRTPKHLYTHQPGGDLLTLHEAYDEQEEAEYVAREIRALLRSGREPGAIAVMYRTNAQSRALEEALMKAGIPYRLIGGTRFYTRREVKDILAYLRLVNNPDDDVSFTRVINVPRRGIGAKTLEAVAAQARVQQGSLAKGMMALLHAGTLSTRAHNALLGFASMLKQWRTARENVTVAALIDHVVTDSGYEGYLRDGSDDGESRWENVMALRGAVSDVPNISLTDFLTEVALVADVDELAEEIDAVTLLTLHSAKGLEYPVVFLTGLEEGMLPHSRSMETLDDIAEERRLLYVGMTRAEERLVLSYAFRRGWGYYGSSEPTEPSRFLADLPDEVLGQRQGRRAPQSTPRASWSVGAWGQSSERTAPRPQPEPEYRTGQRVRHTHYGEGMIIESQMEGRDEMVTVMFSSGVGVKRLLAGMAPLEALSEH